MKALRLVVILIAMVAVSGLVSQSVVRAEGGVCRLDKVGTWSEFASEQAYRIEVRGSGGQHVDFYPAKGVKSVSYIVPAMESADTPWIWWGYGSIWEGAAPECVSFDWVKDATGYASARLDSGHSGLVVDLRDANPVVVANVASLSQSEINSLLARHQQGQGQGSPIATAVIPVTITPAAPVGTCPEGERKDYNPVVDTPFQFNPNHGWVVVNFWSNQTDTNYPEHKLLLSLYENPALLGGGAFWFWPKNCEAAARDNYAKNGLPPVTLSELDTAGLVK